MKEIVVFLICLCVAQLAWSTEYPCTYVSKAGDYYDLSPLSKCDLSGYLVENYWEFVINVCNEVSCNGNKQSGSCQNSLDDCGHASAALWSDYPGGKGVVLKYTQGDPNGCPGNRSSVLTFVCDQDITPDPNISYVSEGPTCTYNFVIRSKYACPTNRAPQKQTCPVRVFLVPHSHDDVGWLQTVEGYYESSVKHILDTIVLALAANPERKFIYVEQAYFTMWWNDPNTTDFQRQAMKKFASNGQLEFVIGGFVMQDEACTTFGADIDQLTLGHQFLLNTFGIRPTKGWQIDPFGASSVTPTLNKLSGFDAHLIDRVTNEDIYTSTQRMEFLWRGSPSLGEKSEIFTEIMNNGYCEWLFSFDFQTDPVNADNVAQWGQKFLSLVNSRISEYRTPNLLAPYGCDFAFQNATPYFNSMDKVLAWLQANEDTTHVYVQYATVSEFFAAVRATPNVDWPVNNGDDFFDYFASYWWSGYFTSRVELKGIVRQGEAISRAIEPLYSIGRVLFPKFDSVAAFNKIETLRVANARAQHHDGVSGTSNPDVVLMFGDDIHAGMANVNDVGANLLSLFSKKGLNQPTLNANVDSLTNLGNGETAAVVIFNSLGWTRRDYVTLPINRNDVIVLDSSLNKTISQVSLAYGGNITSKYHLYFPINVPAMGFNTYFVVAPKDQPKATISSPGRTARTGDLYLQNDYLTVTISGTTGRISNVTNKISNLNVVVDQNLLAYESAHSGAYAFEPKGAAFPLSKDQPKTTIIPGLLVSIAHQEFPCNGSSTSYLKQTIKLYQSNGNPDVGDFIEVFHELGVLPSRREIISAFSTSIQSNNIWSTDSNGFEFQQRRFLWSSSFGGNYYPMVYASFIADDEAQLTLIGERSHGVSSMVNGELEVMLHRNPDMSDNFGPGLTDTSIGYPALRVIVDTPLASKVQMHKQSYLMNFPVSVFTDSAVSALDWTRKYATSGQLISSDLPANVHLLSLNSLGPLSNGTILRFTHLYAVAEHPTFSKSARVDVAALFANLKIASFIETTLTANQVLVNPAPQVIILQPKEIRTFVIQFAPK